MSQSRACPDAKIVQFQGVMYQETTNQKNDNQQKTINQKNIDTEKTEQNFVVESPDKNKIDSKQFSWQDIQKHTFTGWCNAVLNETNIIIDDLYEDLNDGTVLIEVYHLLSSNPHPRYNKKPRIPPQIIENLDIVMKLFQQDGLTTVNIGPMDIYEKNPKLILGFIWHLILYYQIGTSLMVSPNSELSARATPRDGKSSPYSYQQYPNNVESSPISSANVSAKLSMDRMSLESNASPTKSPPSPGRVIRRASLRAKPQKLILDWISSVLDEFTVKNLTTDWIDGIMLGTLVNRFDPKCCANYKKWKRTDAIENVTEALEAAKTHLNIPTIIKPEHLASGEIDPQSFMTYISQFTKKGSIAYTSAFNRLKRLAPHVAKLVSSMDQNYWNDGVALASLVTMCCRNPLQGGYFKQMNFYDGDKKGVETRSIFNISAALMEAEKVLGIEPTFTPDDLYHLRVHPLVFVTYVNHLLNILESKGEVEESSALQMTTTKIQFQYSNTSDPPFPTLSEEITSSNVTSNIASHIQGFKQPHIPSVSVISNTNQLQMAWVSDTDLCYPGDELTFKIQNFSQFNAAFDDVHVEITYFKDDEEFQNKMHNQKSKIFIPFELYQIGGDRIEGKFWAEFRGIYRVQASIKGNIFQPPLYKKTSDSDEYKLEVQKTQQRSFDPGDFECVFRDSYVVVNKDFVLTVYSSKHISPENYEFVFQTSTLSKNEIIAQIDHSDSLRYVYRAKFHNVGTYILFVREKLSGKMFRYENCSALVGDPSKITVVSNNDAFVNPGEIIKIVCDITDAGPGCLTAEVIYENKFFGYASVSSKQEGPRLYAIVTYIVPVIISGKFEFKLSWNNFPVLITDNKTPRENNAFQFISFDPTKAIVQGDGLNKTVPINRDQYFTVTVTNLKCVKKIEGYIQMLEDTSHKKVKVELQPDNHHTFVGCYQLSRVGTYQLDLLINERPVFEKPFFIDTIDLSSVKVKIDSEPRIINQQFVLKVYVYKKAGKGDLYYSLEGPNGPLKMSIEPLQTDSEKECFILCSDTNCAGTYIMDLTYGGYSIEGFPKNFTVPNFEISKNTVFVDTTQLAGLIENTPGEFDFTVDGLDSEQDYKLLTGNIMELDDYENIIKLTPITITINQSNEHGHFVGKFPVTSKNNKVLNLFYNKVPFPGNPYPLDVFTQDSFKLKLKNDIDQIFVNDLVTMILAAPVQFSENQLNCSLKVNSNNETITIDKGRRIQALSPYCEFEYTWTPTSATSYEVCAFFNDTRLLNTSMALKVITRPLCDLMKDHNVLFMADDEVSILPTDEGQISPRIMMNERGNALYLSGYMLSKNGNVKIPLKFKQESSNEGVKLVYAWYYHALPGIYSVWINYDERPLDDSPFRIEVAETHLFSISPDVNYINKSLPLGQTYYFYVTMPATIELQHCVLFYETPKSQTNCIRIKQDFEELPSEDDQVRKLKVPFKDPSNGKHMVGIIYQTISIESTFKEVFIQMENLDVDLIHVEINHPQNVLYNSANEITISNKGLEHDFLNFEGAVYVERGDNSYMQPVSFYRRDKATYICQFYINSFDATQLRINCETQALNGSPCQLNVIDLNRATVVFPLYDSSKPINCEDECLLNVYIPYDCGDGKLRVAYTDPNKKMHMVPHEINTKNRIDEYHSYTARFRPSLQGHYNLRATYGGFDITNSPYEFEVQRPIQKVEEQPQQQIEPDDLAIEFNPEKTYPINKPSALQMYFPKKTNLKDITVKTIDPSHHETILNPHRDPNYTGYYDKYIVELVLKEEGPHAIQIINEVSGNVDNYEVQARKMFSPGLYCVNVPESCYIGEKFTLDVIVDGSTQSSSIRCRCVGPNNEAAFISIITNSSQYYRIYVTPQCVGEHVLELEADKLPIRESPYKLIVLEQEFKDSIKVSGPGLNSSLLNDYIGEIDIDIIGNLDGGILEIHLTGPDNSHQLTSRVVRREKFITVPARKNTNIEILTVKCNYNPLIPGIYIMNILWKGEPLKKCPFKIFLCSNKRELDYLLTN